MDSYDYSSCGVDVPPDNSVGGGIRIGCHRRRSSIVTVTILPKLFDIQAMGNPDSGIIL